MLKKKSAAMLVTCIYAILVWGLMTPTAQAVWHSIVWEPFNETPIQWPDFMTPPGWYINPYHLWGQPPWNTNFVWGITGYVWRPGLPDNQSLFCVGNPGNINPLDTSYPTNVNSRAKYGPINLTNAAYGRISFWYRYDMESVNDYFRWGVWGSNAWSMYEVGKKSGPGPQSWNSTNFRLDSIPNGSGGWLNFLGQSTVYFQIQFISDGYTPPPPELHPGAFIDEVSIGYDDGTKDLEALSTGTTHLDSSLASPIYVGDSLLFYLDWQARGYGPINRFNITCLVDGVLHYTDRFNINITSPPSESFTTFTDIPWVVTDMLPHTVAWMIDADYEVVETSETNNDTLITIQGLTPGIAPTIAILAPSLDDTVNKVCRIIYDARDPDSEAILNLLWTYDTSSFGAPIPGLSAMIEHDGIDSAVWNNIESAISGPVWIQGIIYDGEFTANAFSLGPVIIDHTWGLPAITVTSPAVPDSADATYLITWTDIDVTQTGLISLYHDNNNIGFNGALIVDSIPASDPTNSFLWNTTNIPNGQRWIHAKLQNENGTAQDYSSAPVVIYHPSGVNPWASPADLPRAFALENIFPNPFNNSTSIRIALPHPAQVRIQIFDTVGRLAASPFNGMLDAGRHEIPWTPQDLPSGIYMVRFSAPGAELQSKAVYLK
jgi:hypothetical protein